MLGLRVILTACLLGISAAHVRLTWPPARTFALDFLDNVRTQGPCGMESSAAGPVTTFSPGDTINVTWHLAYSHAGGYRLEILNAEDGSLVSLLTPDTEGDYFNMNDTTLQYQEVMIPEDLDDGAYTLRLTRQAAEWVTSNASIPYIFWSCADVNITTNATCNGGSCSSRGACEGGMCTCNDLASGEACQYIDECMDEEDCSNNGECVDLGGMTYPRRQCFCDDGFFGKDCINENPPGFTNAANYDLSDHYVRVVDDRMAIYYKVLEDIGEIEIALVVEGTTWVGFGWRPININSTCQDWPVTYTSGTPLSEPESEAEPPVSRKRRRRSPDEARVRVVREESEDNDQAWQCVPGVGPVPEGTPDTNPEVEPTSAPEAQPAGTPEPEGEPDGGSPLHPMDCMDIYIGMAIGSRSRIHDYYTRDRATPRMDAFYGGLDGLTAAMGWEGDGETRIIFRRKLDANELTDHPIPDNAPVTAIWARGQEFGMYSHIPASGLERCQASDYTFYKKDELKYHGTAGDQRGVIAELDFYVDPNAVSDEGPCDQQHTIPQTCEGNDCDYRVRITYQEDDDTFDVELTAKVDMDTWTGIGFSSNGAMIGSDAVLVWVDGATGMVTALDYQLNDKSADQVVQDSVQDITPDPDSMTYNDGMLRVTFNRPRVTGDSGDFAFTDEDDGCAMLLLPQAGGGGPVTGGQPQYHTSTPIVRSKTCIRACTAAPTQAPTTGTASIIKVHVPLTFALLTAVVVFLFGR